MNTVFLIAVSIGYLTASAFLARWLRTKRMSDGYARWWLIGFLLCLGWLVMLAATSGGWLLMYILWTIARPEFDPWATIFLFLFSSSFLWLPLIPFAALLVAPPPGRELFRVRSAAALALLVAVGGWIHLKAVQIADFAVTDQHGDPVPNAKLKFARNGFEERFTDASGVHRLHFYRSHGLELMEASCPGYVINASAWPHAQGEPIPSKVVIPAWKIKERSRMLSTRIYQKIPADGEWHYVNLLRGDVSDTPLRFSDLQIKLQSAMGPRRSPKMSAFDDEQFPWRLEVRILHGGCRVATDYYQYEAPASDYDEMYTCEHSGPSFKLMPPEKLLPENLYLRLRDGKVFALLRMGASTKDGNVVSDLGIDADVNPAGSRNLFWYGADILDRSRSEWLPWLRSLFGDEW